MQCYNQLRKIIKTSWANGRVKLHSQVYIELGLQSASPDLTCPDLTCPDMTCPGLACPGLTCPELTYHELTCPYLNCPDSLGPDTSQTPLGHLLAEVEKGVEHGSIAPRRKWLEPFLAEGFGTSLPHLSQLL